MTQATYKNKRVQRNMEKEAMLLGGSNAKGEVIRISRDIKGLKSARNQHMYAVRPHEESSDNPCWTTVLGSQMYELLRADDHEYFYIGKARNVVRMKDGKRKVFNKNYLKFLKLQAKDLIDGQKNRDEHFGSLKDDAEYLTALKKEYARIDRMYEEPEQ